MSFVNLVPICPSNTKPSKKIKKKNAKPQLSFMPTLERNNLKNASKGNIKNCYSNGNITNNCQNNSAITVYSMPKVIIEANVTKRTKMCVKDFNIFHIDSVIRELILEQISSVPHFQKELSNALKILSTGSPKDKLLAKQQVFVLRKKIQDLESTFELLYYDVRTAKILQEFKEIVSSKSSRSFISSKSDTEGTRDLVKKSDLIAKYMIIAREYLDIEGYNQITKKMICSECGSIDMRRLSDEETTFVCMECSASIQIFDDTPSFKDADRVNMCSRYTYTRKGHFIIAVKKYGGKQTLSQEVIDMVVGALIKEIEFHGLTKETVKKSQLHIFLGENDLSKYYDDLNLLYHLITGKPCPDISMYETQLMEDFDEQEKALDKVSAMDPDDKRINSLNVYYKLYKLLQRQGHKCNKDDFYILKTKVKEDEHDDKMKKAWNLLGWKWIETF